MSDNPADSLRRELAEVIHRSGPMHFDRCASRCSGPTAMEQEQAGCVLPFVEAARADERERIAKAIEAQVPGEDEIDTWSVGYMRGMEASAVIARSPARRAVSDGN